MVASITRAASESLPAMMSRRARWFIRFWYTPAISRTSDSENSVANRSPSTFLSR